jgi:hypothetical protein
MVIDTSCRNFPKVKSGPLCGPIAGKPAPTGYVPLLQAAVYLWELACQRFEGAALASGISPGEPLRQ